MITKPTRMIYWFDTYANSHSCCKSHFPLSLSLSLSLYIYIYIYIYIRIFNFIYSFSTNKTLMLTHITAYLWKILKKIMFLSIYSKQWWLIRWKDDDYTNCELENILICYLMKNVFIWCFYRSISWMKIH